MEVKPLPIGIDNFEKMIRGDYYYVDKSMFIKELLDRKGEVNLFTRPRRFGKTLNISMLQYYFEDTSDASVNEENKGLFAGLKIMDQEKKYLDWMVSRPVINLSLKSGKQPTFEMAWDNIIDEIRKEFNRHDAVKKSGKLLENEIRRFNDIQNGTAGTSQYTKSLDLLSSCLAKCYNRKVIILIDEYDVPLENAWFRGFYDRMADSLRALFESALKTNPSLEFAVVTGCLRITKESIFTGLNNLNMISILNPSYGEFFGFVQEEIDEILDYYDLMQQKERIREWYNGYLFGNSQVYNPWSVANYVKALTVNPDELPVPYWANTSSNSIIKSLVEKANISIKTELEGLLAGGTIEKPIYEEITYDSVFDSEDNLWNFLFFTGYLKQVSCRMDKVTRYVTLAVPNLEVEYIYRNTITSWFREVVKARDLSVMYRAMQAGEADVFQKELSKLLQISISFMDTKEAFYHGFLMGIFGNMEEYLVKSNRESGNGRSDIVVRSLDVSCPPMVMELKVSHTYKGLEAACDKALAQIDHMGYDSWLPEEGYTEVWNYGISFYRKQCKIKAEHCCFR